MKTILKWFIVLILLFNLTASSKEKSDEVWVCGRWTWTGDVFNRKVYCLEWARKDCSNRLHKDICKLGG